MMTAPRSSDRPLTRPPVGTPSVPVSTPGSQAPSSSAVPAAPPMDIPPMAPHDGAPAAAPTSTHRRVRRSRTGGIWIGIIVAAVVLIILLIFILQNTATVTIHFLGYSGGVPIAVALLLAAVCGVLLVAVPGTVRILQLRRAVKRTPGNVSATGR